MIPPERETLPPAAETHIPAPARVPTGLLPTDRIDPLASLAERVGDLSDALHDPDGLVHRLFAEAEQRAAERHREVMSALRHVIDNQVEGLARLDKLEPRVDEAEARLHLVPLKGQQQ
jgi:hypothetical protein